MLTFMKMILKIKKNSHPHDKYFEVLEVTKGICEIAPRYEPNTFSLIIKTLKEIEKIIRRNGLNESLLMYLKNPEHYTITRKTAEQESNTAHEELSREHEYDDDEEVDSNSSTTFDRGADKNKNGSIKENYKLSAAVTKTFNRNDGLTKSVRFKTSERDQLPGQKTFQKSAYVHPGPVATSKTGIKETLHAKEHQPLEVEIEQHHWPNSPFPDTPGLTSKRKRNKTKGPSNSQSQTKIVCYSPEILTVFKIKSRKNSLEDKETGAILAGYFDTDKNCWVISDLIFPKQKGTSDFYKEREENVYHEHILKKKLRQLGTIHSHPNFQSFMSSIDLHMHASIQRYEPSAVAIVYSPLYETQPFFSLTDLGLGIVLSCPETDHNKGHLHTEPNETLYMTATNVKCDKTIKIRTLDYRADGDTTVEDSEENPSEHELRDDFDDGHGSEENPSEHELRDDNNDDGNDIDDADGKFNKVNYLSVQPN